MNMKKIIKKIKNEEVSCPTAWIEPEKELIAETPTDFNGEALVGLANKVNEIIRYLNK